MSLFSTYWYRVSDLKPQLRSRCKVHRHVIRGQVWYVLEDTATARHFRFTPSAYQIIGLMDGERNLDEIWRAAAERLGDDLPTQDDVISLLGRLHQADLLISDALPNTVEIATREMERRHRTLMAKVTNPFSIKFPLLDPDAFLERWLPLVRPLISRTGFILWLCLMGLAAIEAGLHWRELTTNFVDRAMAVQNLIAVILVYPIVKTFHELGHGFAVKRWGGEVREIGLMFLVFIPVPYIDASSSVGWPNKWRRISVACMGILVELAIAAMAMLVWINVEPGVTRTVAFSVMLTAGISTLLFNGNPLLRFDGYYAFSDLIEIPNLGQRSNNYVGYLVQRYLLGRSGAQSPVMSPGEKPWLFCYAVAAFCYRIVIVFSIILLVAGQFFAIGTVLAIIAIVKVVIMPIWKMIAFVATDPGLMHVRRRAIAVSLLLVGGISALAFALPLPYRTIAQGVVWRPENSRALAGAPGFVEKVMVRPGDRVANGDLVVKLHNPELIAEVEELKAQVEAFEASVVMAAADGRSAVAHAREQLSNAKTRLARAKSQLDGLVVEAPTEGTFVLERSGEPTGRFVKKGDLFGYVLDPALPTTVRVAVPEAQADLIRSRAKSLSVRFADDLNKIYLGRVVRARPAAGNQLPSPALSSLGAGPFALDSQSPDDMKTFEQIFVVDCEILDPPPLERIGGRAFVRFDLGSAPLAEQVYLPLRQLVLKSINL